jgi:transposase-like protein
MKKILATLVTATLLGVGGLSIAAAAGSPNGSPAPGAAASPSTNGPDAHAREGARAAAFKAAADSIGISTTDLLAAMKGGHSIADVAKSHHVDVQTVIDAVVKALDARIKAGVSSGKITAEQATKFEAAVTKRVPKLVNATLKHLRHRRLVHAAVDVSAKTIGITPADLRAAIESGKSVAEVATAHHVDPATVVHALVTAGTTRIDKAVDAGHLDAARAAKLKARLPQAAQRFVDFTRSPDAKPAAAAA